MISKIYRGSKLKYFKSTSALVNVTSTTLAFYTDDKYLQYITVVLIP